MTDKTCPPATGVEAALDPSSMAAIRRMMESEATSAPGTAPEDETAPHARVAAPRVARPTARKADRVFPPLPEAERGAAPRRRPSDGLRARIRAIGYRPRPMHVVLLCLALLVLFRPWLVAGVLFLMLLTLTGVFLTLGYDGFWRRAMALARWHARRDPARSVELHRRLDSFAVRFDALLDRFPEGTVDGLYLPDFGDLAESEARHDATLDRRFETLRESGA
jgi:hypothetical protein